MTFRNHFLILILLNTTLRKCFKGCNIFQKACSLVRLRTLTFQPKKSDEVFFKIIFLTTEIFFLPKILYMVLLSDNAFSVKEPQKSLTCHFQMSLLLALDSSVSFTLSSSKFCSLFWTCLSQISVLRDTLPSLSFIIWDWILIWIVFLLSVFT